MKPARILHIASGLVVYSASAVFISVIILCILHILAYWIAGAAWLAILKALLRN